jgi:glutamate synthase (ferredoxin)
METKSSSPLFTSNTTERPILGLPKKQGLYDPQFEHDACGTGFIVHVKGHRSHQIVSDALQVLNHLTHRGACGCEANTGDGAGILIQLPHNFFKDVVSDAGFTLPAPGEYGVAMMFLPTDAAVRKECEKRFEQIVQEEGQKFLGWRTVLTNNSTLGNTARAAEPVVRQAFVARDPKLKDDLAFERKLYVIRKLATNRIRYWMKGGEAFYICSFSHRTIVYKGMLMSEQVDQFYPELTDPSMDSALALVHSRFSTNTFPNWERAHPYRFISHNGEINTLRGNINWMRARQAMFESELFGDDIKKILPIINTDGSDSAMFDNCLELLVLAGRPLPHAVMMMIPEPWTNHESMSDEKKAFYEYHSCLMEPWDGPASITFTDGVQIGAVLDRNGLRPSRYYVTKDDLVVMASEVGVLDIAPERILHKGRLQPGRMFLIDTKEGRIIADEEIKQKVASAHPYREWINKHMVPLDDLPEVPHLPEPDHKTVLQKQIAFGYTFEDLRLLMSPMATIGVEAVGSMGTDTPLAVLSEKPQLLYNYFKQLFAQVTNPPIDCIREEIITSAETTIGSEGNLLKPEPQNCHLIELKTPILTNEELVNLRHVNHRGFKSITLPILWKKSEGDKGLDQAMQDLFAQADRAIQEGTNIIILSDRNIDKDLAPIPALLAVAGLHHHLIRNETRTKVGLVLESGEPREVHHFSLLIGYGVGAVNPYLAFETLDDMIKQGLLKNIDHEKACKNYCKAVVKGVVKVISKMGISTIQSYRGAQIFEAIGLNKALVDKYFTWTPSRVEGIGLDVVAREVQIRHDKAFPDREVDNQVLDAGGQYQWRADGEYHLFNPQTIHKLQHACKTGNYNVFKEYSKLVDEQLKQYATLSLLKRS